MRNQPGQGRVSSKWYCGFTLVELLVVIAILSILAAMLLPALAKAKESARLTVCTSNMKSVMTCLNFYFVDFDDYQPACGSYTSTGDDKRLSKVFLPPVALASYAGFPEVGDAPAVDGTAGRFGAYMDRVINNGPIRKSIFFCPSESQQGTSWSIGWPAPFTNYGTVQLSWYEGGVLGNPDWPYYSQITKKLMTAPHPSRTGVFGHIPSHKATYINTAYAIGSWTAYSYGWHTADCGPNHSGALPFSFMDSHVSQIHLDAIKDKNLYGPNGTTPLWGKFLRIGDGPVEPEPTLRGLQGGNTADNPEDVGSYWYTWPNGSPDSIKP